MPLFQGFAAHAAGAELLPYKYDPGEIKPNEVEIAISHCGICRSDVHMVDNDWSISHYPLIPGHEIVGKVMTTGSAVLGLNSGDRVGVGWQANSCGHCEWCLQGRKISVRTVRAPACIATADTPTGCGSRTVCRSDSRRPGE